MKSRYIIAAIIAVAFLAVGMFVMNTSKIEYANFMQAKYSNKTVQVIGMPDKNSFPEDNSSNVFCFYMKDKAGTTKIVEYAGPKPMNFDLAEYVVVKGKYENDKFIAKEILTKCPSKYENELTKRQGEK